MGIGMVMEIEYGNENENETQVTGDAPFTTTTLHP